MERTVSVVYACVDEVCEYVVDVGSAYQLVYGNSHVLSIVSCKDVSEVSCGNNYVYLVSESDLAVLDELCISGNVVYDLRNKTSPVDRVCR